MLAALQPFSGGRFPSSMRWAILLLLTSTLITFVLCRPEKKSSILDGLGKLLKDVLITTTTTTTPAPNFVQELLNRGKNIAQQHYKTNKRKSVGNNRRLCRASRSQRGIAQAVSSQLIDDGIKRGKAYIAQRRNSTVTATPMQSHDVAATHGRSGQRGSASATSTSGQLTTCRGSHRRADGASEGRAQEGWIRWSLKHFTLHGETFSIVKFQIISNASMYLS
uniref:Secreted protein n=1 Tax=Ascaris lumbricoides TaxID=6252 RepID=A0A0M3HQM8_ASCLU